MVGLKVVQHQAKIHSTFSRPKSFPEALPVLDFRLGIPGAEISL